MTCSNCLDGRHVRCSRGDCSCSVCGVRRSSGERKPAERPSRERKPAERSVPSGRVSMTARQKAKDKYGVATDFTDEEVERIFEAKAAGSYISEIAREMDVTRDRVRTIYHAPTAPEAGVRAQLQEYQVKGGTVTGNEHLDKAKAVLEAAKELAGEMSPDELLDEKQLYRKFMHFVDLASVQASLAQAEALTRIAAVMER